MKWKMEKATLGFFPHKNIAKFEAFWGSKALAKTSYFWGVQSWPIKNQKNKSRGSYFWKYLWYVSIQLLLKSVSKYSSRCSVHQRNVYYERVKQKIYDIWKILPTSRRLALNMSFNCLINHQDVCRRPQKAKSQMRFRIRYLDLHRKNYATLIANWF